MVVRNRDRKPASTASVWSEVLCGDGQSVTQLTTYQRLQLAIPLVAIVFITVGLVIRFIMVETFPDDD